MNFIGGKIACNKCNKIFEGPERMYANWEVGSPGKHKFYCEKCSVPYRMIHKLKEAKNELQRISPRTVESKVRPYQ